jgi:hypothetical protein
MSNDFDDPREPAVEAGREVPRPATPAPRLVARLFTTAAAPLRVRLLRCLMQPLGTLGAAGVAAGSFAAFLPRRGGVDPSIDPDAVARLSCEQVCELARFVEQVDPQALQQFATLVAGSPLAMATFSAAALVLLYRRLPTAGAPAARLRAPA